MPFVTTPITKSPTRSAAKERATPRGPTRRDEWVRRVRGALRAQYSELCASPLCELPGVLALARTDYRRKIFPTASALRALLEQACDMALAELDGVHERRVQQVATYLQLAREGVSVTTITHRLGLHSRSYVHQEIQRQALELITEAFLQLARQADESSNAAC